MTGGNVDNPHKVRKKCRKSSLNGNRNAIIIPQTGWKLVVLEQFWGIWGGTSSAYYCFGWYFAYCLGYSKILKHLLVRRKQRVKRIEQKIASLPGTYINFPGAANMPFLTSHSSCINSRKVCITWDIIILGLNRPGILKLYVRLSLWDNMH